MSERVTEYPDGEEFYGIAVEIERDGLPDLALVEEGVPLIMKEEALRRLRRAAEAVLNAERGRR